MILSIADLGDNGIFGSFIPLGDSNDPTDDPTANAEFFSFFKTFGGFSVEEEDEPDVDEPEPIVDEPEPILALPGSFEFDKFDGFDELK